MSDSDESGITYIDISSPFEEFSDIGSPRVPPSPDYIPGPEEPEQAPPLPDYITCPEHVDDEIVAEEQPYTEDASPIAQSPEYVLESDFEAHPEDDDDEDPEEDPVDYLADGGDDGDDEEEILAISSPPASPLSPWSLPPPQIPFPLLPSILSPPSPVLGIALGPGYEVGESSSAAAARLAEGLRAYYGFGAPVSTDTELGGYMREFNTRVRKDT
nr:hypothetical protein [Tanacetum cinerariifolium]